MSKKIGIVYFIYINPKKDWRKIISGQLKDVAATGILNDADLYLEVSAPAENNEINRFFEDLPYSIASIDMHYQNAYEYFGIHKLLMLGGRIRIPDIFSYQGDELQKQVPAEDVE